MFDWEFEVTIAQGSHAASQSAAGGTPWPSTIGELISSSRQITSAIRHFPKCAYRGIPYRSLSSGLALASSLEHATGEMENGHPEEETMSETMIQLTDDPEIADSKLCPRAT